MKVPIISRLNFRDYQALVIGLFFLFLERSVRLVTYCFPNFVLEYLRSLSQKLYSMKHEDTRTDPAKIIQFSTTFREMVEYWGYSMEEHIVKTRDDYLLGIHRIPTGKFSDDDDDKSAESHIKSVFNNCGIPLSAIRTKYPRSSTKETKEKKPVVLLYHGLMMCSEIWMCNMEEERQLPFLLADAGYDVWFGNARGNKYSMKHTRYKPNDGQFWEYSMDEFALFDLPDTIDYILETTGVPSLTYIGFSQGTAQSFAALSINPSLNNKVNLFIALAPATSPVGLQNPIVDAFIKASPNIVYLFFGRKAFLTMAMFWQKVLSPPIYTELLDRCMKLLFGWDGRNMTKDQKSVSYSHLYSFTSVKSLVHWFQIIRARKFQMYDELPPYSSSTAMGYYCHEFPTRQIKTPIGVFYGGSDSLVDINVLLKQLPKPVFTKEVQPYEHLDFLWASDVHKTVYPELFDLLSKYSNVRHKIDDEINNDYQHINEKEFN